MATNIFLVKCVIIVQKVKLMGAEYVHLGLFVKFMLVMIAFQCVSRSFIFLFCLLLNDM